MFFQRLDEELEKVNRFYTDKETEFLERWETLHKQLQILLEVKQILRERRRRNFKSPGSSLHGGFLSRSNSLSAPDSDYSGKLISFVVINFQLIFVGGTFY